MPPAPLLMHMNSIYPLFSGEYQQFARDKFEQCYPTMATNDATRVNAA